MADSIQSTLLSQLPEVTASKVSDTDIVVLENGTTTQKITVAQLKEALGINALNTKIIFKDHAILPTIASNEFRTFKIIDDPTMYAKDNGLDGYTLIGAIVNSGGCGDQWQVTASLYGSSMFMQVKSYYPGELTVPVSCYSVWAKL